MAAELPQPPFYAIKNIDNLRDAALFPGGLNTTSGGKIREGVLYRSADPSKLDKDGWSSLRQIGVAHLFDLRSLPELEKGYKGVGQEELPKDANGDSRYPWIDTLEAAGLNRTWTPVFKAEDYSPERLVERYIKYMDKNVEGFVAAYRDILSNAGPAYRTILRYLINLPSPASTGSSKPLGALIHCTAGKDRTGIFFGVLFSYLGVPEEKIAEEYNLTETGLARIRDEVAARLMQSPAFRKYMENNQAGKETSASDLASFMQAGNSNEGADATLVNGAELSPEALEFGRQAALRMVGARKESMLHSLKMAEKEFGGAEKYLRRVCELTDGDLDALRRNLVVPA
ncbi:hypothetical protein BU24DRAFT_421940 [Aaosphaeria arxii CBS 175.79]|uniref:Tyrosine specific protein phosphatases domain-containing protein n=1 Tax=Aaosphaeria arxii CBS 175.79 TaxID=1450172 RepID=A0A6A5XR35_9PLEO|nr:uncharacterized protein BU24DRAFT_421940 [Aaosphaeria arxii CBS 175.79]KAF2015642.1 hypothetical protein BU24DRAFT_421940 [Aaosphaeria arxii CBS 175.79]